MNHFHDDCLGGLQAFHDAGIRSYAQAQTPALAAEDGAVIPQKTCSNFLKRGCIGNVIAGELLNCELVKRLVFDTLCACPTSQAIVMSCTLSV